MSLRSSRRSTISLRWSATCRAPSCSSATCCTGTRLHVSPHRLPIPQAPLCSGRGAAPEGAAVAGVRGLGLPSRLRARSRGKAPPPCSPDRAAEAERDAAKPALIRDDLPGQEASGHVIAIAPPLAPGDRIGAPCPVLVGGVGDIVSVVRESVVGGDGIGGRATH
jgi:hypothetical protein